MESILKYGLGGDPVQNLRSILHGSQVDMPSDRVQKKASSFDTIDQLDDDDDDEYDPAIANTSASHLHFLLKQQDEYIEQLELENKTLKNELKNIQTTARRITDENQRIIQNWKMDIFQHLLPKKEEKGMSDEEKAFYGRAADERKDDRKNGGCGEHDSKIKQLESEIMEIRKSIGSKDNAAGEPLPVPSTSSQFKFAVSKKEWDDLNEINARLRETVAEMQTREEEAQNRIEKGIRLVEEAHLEKTEALAEREQLKDELIEQRKRIDESRTEHERRTQDEIRRALAVKQKRIEETEAEVIVANETLVRLKANLERANRERRDLEERREQTERDHEVANEDLRKTIVALRSEETMLRLERNDAARQAAQTRDAWERSKQEQSQELLVLRSDLNESNGRLKRMEREYLRANGELAATAEKILHLQSELDECEQRRRRNFEGYSRDSRNGELSRRNDGLERVVEQQMRLVEGFRIECKRLAEQLSTLSEQSEQSMKMAKSENANLSESLSASNDKCKRLEMLCDEGEKRYRDATRRAQSMKTENEKHSQKIIDLLRKQTQLLKERQYLRDEMHLLHDKLDNA